MSTIREIHINGAAHAIEAASDHTLLSVLRDDLHLTGTKYGCGEGQCGACTVMIDGVSVRSCMTSMASTLGKKIVTIEGLEQDGRLHPLQEAFLETGALQCGYCTSGMIMSGVALLRRNPKPARQEIIRYMEGNICRCCTYPRIIAAIERAAGGGQ